MTGPEMFGILALITLLSGLIVALVALQRLRHGVHVTAKRMSDAAPAPATGETERKTTGLMDDLRQMERAFEEMKARNERQAMILDQACEQAALGTWTILPDLKSVRTSSHMRAILGFSETDDVVDIDAFRDRILPEDQPVFDAALKRALTERRTIDAEFRALDARGVTRIFRARTGPDGPVQGGELCGISGIIQDITDIRHKETELSRSLRLERLAGEVASLGGWRYDVATRKVSATREKVDLVGADIDTILSIDDQIARFEGDDERRRIESGFWTCVGAGTRFDEIGRFRRLDGTETWLRMIGEAERDESGEIVSIYGATQDVSELVSAKSEREEIRALLQTILNALGDGFVIQACDGTIQYMNRSAHNILGVPNLDLVGSNIRQCLSRDAASQFQGAVDEALNSGKSRSFEGEITTPGQWVNVSVMPTPAGIAIYLEDVTEERASRARLRLLDAAVAQVSDVVMIADARPIDAPGPRIVFVNKAFETMTGYSRDEIIGATPRLLQGPDTERDRLDAIRTAITAGKPIRTELTNYRKDGAPYTAEIDLSPLFDDTGECTHYVSIQRDTTERRQQEEHLRKREEQFRLAGMASDEIIWDWDLHTGTIWNSSNKTALSGLEPSWTLEELVEGRIEQALERIHPDDRLKITESLDAALSSEAQSWHCEYRMTNQNGEWKNIYDKAFIVRNDDGTPRRVVGAMSDVTNLRALDAQLHQAQKLESVGQLTGGIAHDFNNLLTVILGNCDMLLDDSDDESPDSALLRSIEEAAERGARISHDLLAFSRLQMLEPRATDINGLIRRASGLFEQAIDESMELRYELTDAQAIGRVDPAKLEAGLLNLVLNAWAATPQDGHITIRTRLTQIEKGAAPAGCQPGAYVEIDVIDDGTGMSPEVSRRAFEPFFTTKEPGVGTGMGLSSVQGLMKQSGGHAAICSAPGMGTTVTLSIPAAGDVEADDPQEPPQVHRPGGGGDRILVVEDDTELRAFVRTALSRMGYHVVEAETGAIALKLLETDKEFDLIVSDIVMPGGVNGVQLAREAQKMHPGLRILFTSGYPRDALSKERDVPSDIPMLPKPFRTIELLTMVKETLTQPNVRSE